MVFIHVTATQFLKLGLEDLVGFDHRKVAKKRILRRWHAYFGASPETCATIFEDLQTTAIGEAHVEEPCVIEFLVAFYWLKSNASEEQVAGLFKMDERTVRKWKWFYIKKIVALKEQKVRRYATGDTYFHPFSCRQPLY